MKRALLALVAALLLVPGAAGAARYVAGAPGSGDLYFPLAGNGGYDVRHYALDLDYDQPANFLEGHAEIRARATQSLHRFNLDLRDFYEVSRVTVDGKRARFHHEGQELSIDPRPKLKRGKRFEVEVHYAGQPQPVVDPDGSSEGWIPTDDGAFVVNEPQGSPGWYPVNDSPLDKATYDFDVTVPAGHTVMANGELVSRRTRGGETTWRWRERDPMAPYLATATNGPFETDFYKAGGLLMYDAVDPDTRASGEPGPNPALAWERLEPQPEIIDFFSELYGRYPFTSGGGIVDWAPNVGYALESQTRANYHRTPSASTVVHEIAHQWFGNAVTLSVWPDIWLNEGFATWSEWIYDERHGGASAQETFDELYEGWQPGSYLDRPPGNVGGPQFLFSGTVYDRGAMTLQALREKVGDHRFFRILRAWYSENKHGNVTTADLVALSERIWRQRLDEFFEVWLYTPGKPSSW